MKLRYRLFRRKNGILFLEHRATRQQESLRTRIKEAAIAFCTRETRPINSPPSICKLRARITDLWKQTPTPTYALSQIDLAAATDAFVLIPGDTGAGKELVAREIHHRSRRKD